MSVIKLVEHPTSFQFNGEVVQGAYYQFEVASGEDGPFIVLPALPAGREINIAIETSGEVTAFTTISNRDLILSESVEVLWVQVPATSDLKAVTADIITVLPQKNLTGIYLSSETGAFKAHIRY